MASLGMQMLASGLCLFGWAGVLISCLLPLWRVTAFVGSTIVTSQTIWEGIWMTCVVQSTGQMSCKPYESLLALSGDLQAARALTVLSVATGAMGLILAFVGGKCTRFLDGEGGGAKGKVAVAAGVVLIVAGVLCLIPSSWVAGAVVKKFYSASVDAQRREIGACLYIGWGASILLVLGGGLFIHSSCPLKAHDQDNSPSVRYMVVRSSNGSAQMGSHRSRVPPARAQPVTVLARPQSLEGPTPRPPPYTPPPPEDGPEQYSERSWASSSKSQMKRRGSVQSDPSEALSTKSQLKRAEMEDDSSRRSDDEDASSNPARTYL